MLIVASLNLFSSVMEAFGQCIWCALKADSLVLGEGGENARLLCVFFLFVVFLSSAQLGETLPGRCELRPSDLRCKDSLQSYRTGSDKEQALAPTSNRFYLSVA